MTPPNPTLISRIRSATEGSRELDIAIFKSLGGTIPFHALGRVDDPYLVTEEDGKTYKASPSASSAFHLPPVTTSLDAALALVERVRPGWAWGIDHGPSSVLGFLDPNDYEQRFLGARFVEHASTAPLALIAALLASLEEADV